MDQTLRNVWSSLTRTKIRCWTRILECRRRIMAIPINGGTCPRTGMIKEPICRLPTAMGSTGAGRCRKLPKSIRCRSQPQTALITTGCARLSGKILNPSFLLGGHGGSISLKLACFGMGGWETLIWNRIVRTRYSDWVSRPRFVVGQFDLKGLPDNPPTLAFADEIKSAILLEHKIAG